MIEIATFFFIVIMVAVFLYPPFKPFESRLGDVDERLKIPEDSVLRRHFLTDLQKRVEAEFSPRPTDSTLKRHYNSFIQSEMQKRLAGERL